MKEKTKKPRKKIKSSIPWTQFFDMHSGGGNKEKWENIYIQAPKSHAKIIFNNRFGHDPDRITCECCGEDYSITEYKTLEDAVKYQRREMSFADFIKKKDVLIIKDRDIRPKERV